MCHSRRNSEKRRKELGRTPPTWSGHQRGQVNVLPFFALKTLWMASCENEALRPCHAPSCLASWIP